MHNVKQNYKEAFSFVKINAGFMTPILYKVILIINEVIIIMK